MFQPAVAPIHQPTPAPPDVDADAGRPYWRESVARHEQPSLRHSLVDIATSVVPYLALTAGMYLCLDVSVWIALALAVPAAGFLLRTFVVFHDCAHGSFLSTKRANLWLGRLTGLLVFQPFGNWRHNHAVHHGTAGDLDRRGTGDVSTLTVEEYRSRPWKQRLGYRMFRSPLVMFGIGPIWSLMIGPRIWSNKMRSRQRRSVLATNLALAIVVGTIVWLAGLQAWLLVQMPIAILAGTVGVFMFYVQHQFEDVYWESSRALELRRCRPAGKFLPEAAEALPVLQREHRPAPRSPPQRQDSQLQPAAHPRREPDLPRCPCAERPRRAARNPTQGDRSEERPTADLGPGQGSCPGRFALMRGLKRSSAGARKFARSESDAPLHCADVRRAGRQLPA